uniref:MoCF_biosynth domain-containing protein n=1 Tax=Parastrongyloides trichosuri TaxID=131310 RepID=A0A0N4ZE17_PARTI
MENQILSSIITRPRTSPYPAISMEDALKIIDDEINEIMDCKEVHFDSVDVGRILADNVIAQHDHPSERLSVKDGYAVFVCDGIGERKVVSATTAGSVEGGYLRRGECCRVSTGSMVPEGADAVVQVEDTTILQHDNFEEKVISINVQPLANQDIRPVGFDFKKDEVLIHTNTKIGPAEKGMIVQSGMASVRIYRKPKVCVMSTGNELIDPLYDGQIPKGKIRDSNRPQLLSLFNSYGFHAIDVGIAPDDKDLLARKIGEAFEFSNVIVTSGGVSMGEKDLLKNVLMEVFNFNIKFGRVFMKPGLPTTFATGKYRSKDKRYIFALPGNPVSSLVSAYLFVIPALLKMSGLKCEEALQPYTKLHVKIEQDIKLDIRPEYRRAWLKTVLEDPVPHAVLTTQNQASSVIKSSVSANLLLQLPPSTHDQPILLSGTIITALVVGRI